MADFETLALPYFAPLLASWTAKTGWPCRLLTGHPEAEQLDGKEVIKIFSFTASQKGQEDTDFLPSCGSLPIASGSETEIDGVTVANSWTFVDSGHKPTERVSTAVQTVTQNIGSPLSDSNTWASTALSENIRSGRQQSVPPLNAYPSRFGTPFSMLPQTSYPHLHPTSPVGPGRQFNPAARATLTAYMPPIMSSSSSASTSRKMTPAPSDSQLPTQTEPTTSLSSATRVTIKLPGRPTTSNTMPPPVQLPDRHSSLPPRQPRFKPKQATPAIFSSSLSSTLVPTTAPTPEMLRSGSRVNQTKTSHRRTPVISTVVPASDASESGVPSSPTRSSATSRQTTPDPLASSIAVPAFDSPKAPSLASPTRYPARSKQTSPDPLASSIPNPLGSPPGPSTPPRLSRERSGSRQCSNCSDNIKRTTSTGRQKRSKLAAPVNLCNACSLYTALNNRPRPSRYFISGASASAPPNGKLTGKQESEKGRKRPRTSEPEKAPVRGRKYRRLTENEDVSSGASESSTLVDEGTSSQFTGKMKAPVKMLCDANYSFVVDDDPVATIWRKLLDNWLAIEGIFLSQQSSIGFNVPSNIPSSLPNKGRPECIHHWIHRARATNWRAHRAGPTGIDSKTIKSVPVVISTLRKMDEEFKSWWKELKEMHEGSSRDDEGAPILLCPGVNGLLSVMAVLFFWAEGIEGLEKEEVGESSESVEILKKEWAEAVADVSVTLDGIHKEMKKP